MLEGALIKGTAGETTENLKTVQIVDENISSAIKSAPLSPFGTCNNASCMCSWEQGSISVTSVSQSLTRESATC